MGPQPTLKIAEMYELMDIKPILGREIGRGTKKICYLHRSLSDRCLKVCDKKNFKFLDREVGYQQFLKDKGRTATFMPQIFGTFSTETQVGVIEECFIDRAHGGTFDEVHFLADLLYEGHPKFHQVISMLKDLKEEMVKKNIILNDLHGRNLLVVKKADVEKIVVIDGYGTTEAIPFPKYFKFFGRLKIQRQWDKFVLRHPLIGKYCP